MFRQLGHPNVRICVSPHGSPGIVSVREKSKFRGKKQKQYDEVTWQHNNVPLQPHEDFEPDEFKPRRLTYHPEGLWSSLVPRPRPPWWVDKLKPLTIKTLDPPEKEWNEVAEYPEIVKDPKIEHFFLTSYLNRTKWYKELAALPSADEKNASIAKITRMSLSFLQPYFMHFNGREAIQNITRTHLVDGQLPDSYSTSDVDQELVNRLTSLLLDVVRVNKYEVNRQTLRWPVFGTYPITMVDERIKENSLIQEINQAILSVLAPTSPHLVDLNVGVETRARSWWYASQLPLPSVRPFFWKIKKYEKIDQLCTYDCVTPLTIRTSSPLPKVVSGSDDLSLTGTIPELTFHPERFKAPLKNRYLTSLPGFWPSKNFDPSQDEADDFPYLTIFGTHELPHREYINYHQDFKDKQDVIKCKAILGSFAWLNGLAFYHGFTPFHEITYPFVNQGLVTDGQNYHFFVYQMNSHSFHSDLFDGEGPRNICWISPEMKLYDSYQDGQFTGINTDIVKLLIKMYSQVPEKDPNVHYRPLIGKDERDSEQIKEMRRLISQRTNNVHSREMHSYKYARKKQLYHKIFVDNPDYDTTMMRIAIIPRLKPAEDYYYQWKY